MDVRCFIAIEIPEMIKRDIGELIEFLRKYNVDVKWVIHENIHITLKFLGNTSETLLPRIYESLSHMVLSYKTFCIKISGIGVFPNRKYPRVIWTGIEDTEILKRLQKDIEDSMTMLGFKREDKEFHPHLTLGRVKSQKGMPHLMNELDNIKGKDFGVINVKSIKLMQSKLKQQGAEYSCLYEIPFGREKDR